MSMFNPEMMKNLMENEEIQNMMNDPETMNNLQNMMKNNNLFGGLNLNDTCETSETCPETKVDNCTKSCSETCGNECDSDIEIEELENMELEQSKFNIGDKIITCNLKNKEYNNKKGVIEDWNGDSNRYIIELENEKYVAIKEENLKDRFENIENID